jgi:hypothetical protein
LHLAQKRSVAKGKRRRVAAATIDQTVRKKKSVGQRMELSMESSSCPCALVLQFGTLLMVTHMTSVSCMVSCTLKFTRVCGLLSMQSINVRLLLFLFLMAILNSMLLQLVSSSEAKLVLQAVMVVLMACFYGPVNPIHWIVRRQMLVLESSFVAARRSLDCVFRAFVI